MINLTYLSVNGFDDDTGAANMMDTIVVRISIYDIVWSLFALRAMHSAYRVTRRRGM